MNVYAKLFIMGRSDGNDERFAKSAAPKEMIVWL